MDDFEIVELFLQRDENAIKEAKNKYGSYCRYISMRILSSKEDSEECENDTFLNAWESIPPAKPENLKAYLGKISRNLSLNTILKKERKKRGGTQTEIALSELEDCLSSGGSIDEGLESEHTAAVITAYLKTLSKENRVFFIRRYWFFEHISVISANYGVNKSKVKSSLYRSRIGLRSYLEKEGINI